ncbi:MAG: NAD-dependent epimerase/dehydratase family protein [Blastocatellia bacterium]|nr:NAD-dependent epimerase/dehydratase family protein [Blastocatellia bacterium]
MKKKNVVVTGGSGYLGSHVKSYFEAADLSRRSGFDIISNIEDVKKIADFDVVIHMAALVDKRPEAANRTFEVNVNGTLNLLQSLREGQIFIFCSTKDVYGNNVDKYNTVPETCSTEYIGQGAYEWSKLIAEKYVQFYCNKAKVRHAIFRLSTIYAKASPENRGGFVSFFADSIINGKPLHLKMLGKQRRDLLHVTDLASAFESFIDSHIDAGLYNIGGGEANSITLYELTRLLGRLSRQKPNLTLSEEAVKEQIHYVTDLAKIERELGWTPKITIEEGLRRIL